MVNRVDNAFFLCSATTACSILADAMLAKKGAGRFRALPIASLDQRALSTPVREIGAQLPQPEVA